VRPDLVYGARDLMLPLRIGRSVQIGA
jgi:hypothetical protein